MCVAYATMLFWTGYICMFAFKGTGRTCTVRMLTKPTTSRIRRADACAVINNRSGIQRRQQSSFKGFTKYNQNTGD